MSWERDFSSLLQVATSAYVRLKWLASAISIPLCLTDGVFPAAHSGCCLQPPGWPGARFSAEARELSVPAIAMSQLYCVQAHHFSIPSIPHLSLFLSINHVLRILYPFVVSQVQCGPEKLACVNPARWGQIAPRQTWSTSDHHQSQVQKITEDKSESARTDCWVRNHALIST